jgi:hypothetical protein
VVVENARPDYDQPLKAWLERAHDAFLALVAPDVRWAGELSPVLPAIARQADLAWEVAGRDGARGLLHAEPLLWPLAPLLAGATVETMVAVAERLAQAPLPQVEPGELIGLLGLLAGLRIPRDVVMQALRRNLMIRDIIEESSFAQLLIEEGREEGRQEGQRAAVRSVLESRFGPLEASALAALETADGTALQSLLAHLTTDTWEQVRARLGFS